MEGVRNRVGMLCDQLSRFPDLHDVICDAGADGELDKLLAALGGVDEPDEDQVLGWLQAIEDACARKGLAGITSREHAFRPRPPGCPRPPSSRCGCVRRAGATAWCCRKRHKRHPYARWPEERR